MPSRHKARRRALDVLFEADQRRVDITSTLAERREITAAQTPLPEFAATIVAGVGERITDIDEVLATYSQSWTVERMPAVDRAALRIGVWEILFSDTEDAVAVDEATTLVAELSTDDSPKFVNGLLARVALLKPAILAGM